jgi:iron complex transport system substrate-binding protein
MAVAGCRSSEGLPRDRSSEGLPRDSASGVRVRSVDGLGRSVELPRPARRIASLSPSNTEIVFLLGCGARLVLRDRASDYPRAARLLPATDPFRLSVEHIAGFAPDLVLASHLDSTRVAALGAVGLRVAVFDPVTVARVLEDVQAISRLCGRPQVGQRWVEHARRRLRRLQRGRRDRARPRVYVELDGSDPLKPWTVGAGSLVGDVLRLAGGANLFADIDRRAAQVSVEEVLRRAPEVILLAARGATAASLRSRPGWERLPALAQGRVIDSIDPALIARPGPRLVEGVELLARALSSAHEAHALTTGEGKGQP